MTTKATEGKDRPSDTRAPNANDGEGINSPKATLLFLIGLVAVAIVLGLIFT